VERRFGRRCAGDRTNARAAPRGLHALDLREVVVAVVALRFRLDQGHSLSATAAGSTLIAVGSVVGALLADYALTRTSMRRILIGSGLLCLAALLLLITTSSLIASLVLLWLLGVGAAPHHPLMQAAAYEEVPGSPGFVNAALQLFVVVEIGAPLLVGVVAERLGLSWALLVLGLQPLVIVAVAQRSLARH
jgi:MFS family permease